MIADVIKPKDLVKYVSKYIIGSMIIIAVKCIGKKICIFFIPILNAFFTASIILYLFNSMYVNTVKYVVAKTNSDNPINNI